MNRQEDRLKTATDEKNHSHVLIGVCDINGILRSKYISQKKFQSALENGFGFCDVIMGSDIDDQLISNMQYTGWHSGYPDALLEVDAGSVRYLPYDTMRPLYLCDFAPNFASLCPRSVLKKIIANAQSQHYYPLAGMEFEFSLFQESPRSLKQKNYHPLETITEGNCGYSLLRTTQYGAFYDRLFSVCESMNIPIEGLHTEIGPGVLEIAISKGPMLETADHAILLKHVIKTLAQEQGWMASFMAKWSSEFQGQSGHIHLSLLDQNQNNLFYEEVDPLGMSDLMKRFVAGQLKLLPEFLAMLAPFVNSYTRLVPDYWAPTSATWGVDNRTCALRIIKAHNHNGQRIEHRVAGADCNPYLAMASVLASGLWGVEQALTLAKPQQGNAYQGDSQDVLLPDNLTQAAMALKNSDVAEQYFGKGFVEDYTRRCFWEASQAQKAVTDWQKARYFELV